MSFIKDRIMALKYACNGLWESFRREIHIPIHTGSAILAITAGWYFSITVSEWLFIALAIVLVLITELFNTAVERISDLINVEKNSVIKYVKDISAASVLLASIFAILAGYLIFWPYFRNLVF